jgi:hypothetical protein
MCRWSSASSASSQRRKSFPIGRHSPHCPPNYSPESRNRSRGNPGHIAGTSLRPKRAEKAFSLSMFCSAVQLVKRCTTALQLEVNMYTVIPSLTSEPTVGSWRAILVRTQALAGPLRPGNCRRLYLLRSAFSRRSAHWEASFLDRDPCYADGHELYDRRL